VPAKLATVLQTGETIRQLAHWMADTRSVLFLGRHVGYPVALEERLGQRDADDLVGEREHREVALLGDRDDAGAPSADLLDVRDELGVQQR
ncbi:hypothetical protein ACC691_38925, partial [Rhizobium johnstonii]